MTRYKVYDDGKEIGVLFRESGDEYNRYPIEYQDSIVDTYNLAQRTCDILNAFKATRTNIPKGVGYFIKGWSTYKPTIEEYLTDLRLFLQFGLPDTCGQCRLFLGDRPCKHQYPTGSPMVDSYPCDCGIRKEQNNA